MAESLKAVVFDYGGVLCLHDNEEHLQRMAGMCGVPVPRFREAYEEPLPAFDRGDFDGIEFWNRVLGALDVAVDEKLVTLLISEDTESVLVLDDRVVEWAEVLRRGGFGTAILSNINREELTRLRESRVYERLAGFSPAIFSCEVGIVKPDPAIYNRCLRGLRLLPGSVLLVDGNEASLRAARDLGLHAYRFHRYETSVPDICMTYSLPSMVR